MRGVGFLHLLYQADRAWAEWIAWVLEEDGHRVLVPVWEFVAPIDMHAAVLLAGWDAYRDGP